MKPIRKPPTYSNGQGYSDTLVNPCVTASVDSLEFLDATLASDLVIWQETKRTTGTMPAVITIDGDK